MRPTPRRMKPAPRAYTLYAYLDILTGDGAFPTLFGAAKLLRIDRPEACLTPRRACVVVAGKKTPAEATPLQYSAF